MVVDVALRRSLAPRVLDGRLAQQSLESNARLSVRASPPAASDAPILTTFVWKAAGTRVQLAGSFDDWRKHDMTCVADVKTFVLVVEIPPGQYFYRFVVDGHWCVADDDPNLREDTFGEMSHFIDISAQSVANARPKRFSTASVARSAVTGTVVVDDGSSDTEDEGENDENEPPLPPRQRGNGFVEDYDDDACGELDLQADVFEAMKDVAEKTTDSAPTSPALPVRARRRKPGRRMMARVWALLFGDTEEETEPAPAPPSRNQKLHALALGSGLRGLRVWFPNEQNFPDAAAGRKMAEGESRQIIDPSDVAMRIHQVEENAQNRQMLGKTLFAQGKYDAALALFSLSVKLREDNGLKNAKSTAVAHTDVASAFIHLDDLKNAEKHLRIALDVFQKGTFSGGRVQLGDVHCFLGVVADMRNYLKDAELCYRNAIDLYEKSKSTEHNPNYSTAIDNLNANIKRQTQADMDGGLPAPSPKEEKKPFASPRAKIERRTPSKTNTPVRSPRAPPSKQPRRTPNQSPAHRINATPSPRRPPVSPHTNRAMVTPKRSPIPGYESDDFTPTPSPRAAKRRSSRPQTWKDLAEHARKSMPRAPPPPPPQANAAQEEEEEHMESGTVGSYEQMSRGWHNDGRKLLAKGSFKEAIDMYTLAIYTRKRHGPWHTKHNAQTHIDYARTQFATKDLPGAAQSLRDAIDILETVNKDELSLLLGETWGSLGSVLDRLGSHGKEAESAHCAGMVVFGRSGMSKEDKRWMKAWKNLCVNLTAQGPAGRSPEEAWDSIDLQIRGIQPLSKIADVVIRL